MANEAPVALITGAGSGIGRATSIALARKGWRLVLVGRTDWKLDETKSAIADTITEPVDFMSTPVDIAEEGIPEALVSGIREYWGRLDVLVNNAGIGPYRPIAKADLAMVRQTFAINTMAPAMLIAHAWELFEETLAKDTDATPCVVNISSMAAHDPFPGLGVYGASKAAIEGLTRAIHSERGALNLRAFSIAPGAVETEMLRSILSEEDLPTSKTLEADDVAGEIVACIEGARDERDGETIMLPPP